MITYKVYTDLHEDIVAEFDSESDAYAFRDEMNERDDDHLYYVEEE